VVDFALKLGVTNGITTNAPFTYTNVKIIVDETEKEIQEKILNSKHTGEIQIKATRLFYKMLRKQRRVKTKRTEQTIQSEEFKTPLEEKD
jgi:hypothetical protein